MGKQLSKQYIFNSEEVLLLREALAEYKHFIKPPADAPVSARRKRVIARASRCGT